MTKAELLERLAACKRNEDGDQEQAHVDADAALLEYINDPEIEAAFHAIEKWYA